MVNANVVPLFEGVTIFRGVLGFCKVFFSAYLRAEVGGVLFAKVANFRVFAKVVGEGI